VAEGASGMRYHTASLEAWAWAVVALERTKLRGLTPAAHYLRDRIRAGLSAAPLTHQATVELPPHSAGDDLDTVVDRVVRFGVVPKGAQQHTYMLGVRALQELVGVAGGRSDGATGYIERRTATGAGGERG
jgi:hypothetical protein